MTWRTWKHHRVCIYLYLSLGLQLKKLEASIAQGRQEGLVGPVIPHCKIQYDFDRILTCAHSPEKTKMLFDARKRCQRHSPAQVDRQGYPVKYTKDNYGRCQCQDALSNTQYGSTCQYDTDQNEDRSFIFQPFSWLLLLLLSGPCSHDFTPSDHGDFWALLRLIYRAKSLNG
jgi:hypothetical protein